MTYKEFLNMTTDNDKLATFLFNFSRAFYLEEIPCICDTKSCSNQEDGCYSCIKEWLDTEADESLLMKG